MMGKFSVLNARLNFMQLNIYNDTKLLEIYNNINIICYFGGPE
jgi:hypothetical protein